MLIMNQPLNPKTEAEIKEIVQHLQENSKPISLENFDTQKILVAKPNRHSLNTDTISYQIFSPNIRMRTKMKINYFSGNFSLAMEISNSQKEILNEIENKIREETQKHDAELKKLNPKSQIILENLKLVKESCSGPKMHGKIYLRNDVSTAKFFKKEGNKKQEMENPLEINSEFTGEVIFDITRIFLGEKESIICAIKGVLVDEIEEDSFFDDLLTID